MGWLKNAFKKAVGISQYVSPLGLTTKITSGKSISSVPEVDDLASTAGKLSAGLGSALAGAGQLTDLKNNSMFAANDSGTKTNSLFGGSGKLPVGGSLNFGSNSTQGYIPLIIAAGVAFIFIFRDVLLGRGTTRKRRRR